MLQKFYIPHKLSVGDISRLSDQDSRFAIESDIVKLEDNIIVDTPNGSFFAVVTHISEGSVEVEILKENHSNESAEVNHNRIVLLQAVSSESKFSYLLEKSVELGVDEIQPIQTEYSLLNSNAWERKRGLWGKVIKDAAEQSRNRYPTTLSNCVLFNDMLRRVSRESGLKICLTTENIECLSLDRIAESEQLHQGVYIAIGPEKGWSASELEQFKHAGFKFVRLNCNILRTESAGIVISSILMYLQGRI